MTFEEWWATAQNQYSLDDADSLRTHFLGCWNAAYDQGHEEGIQVGDAGGYERGYEYGRETERERWTE